MNLNLHMKLLYFFNNHEKDIMGGGGGGGKDCEILAYVLKINVQHTVSMVCSITVTLSVSEVD